MIVHVVLFTPAPDLPRQDRDALMAAAQAAFSGIPGIERARIGRRTRLGFAYDGLPGPNVEYVAMLEFVTEDALRDYLHHPDHAALGLRFGQSASTALVYDFTTVDASRVGDLVNDA